MKTKKFFAAIAIGMVLVFGAGVSSKAEAGLWDALKNTKVGDGSKKGEKVAHWNCYHCGKAATTEAYNPSSNEPKAYPPKTSESCSKRKSGGHEWVWKSGVSQAKPEFSHFKCDYCNKRVDVGNPAQGLAKPPTNVAPCKKASNGKHRWQRLPIW